MFVFFFFFFLSTVVKEAREKTGMSQRELAERLGVSIRTVQNYESGKHEPNEETLQKISDILNVPVDSFYPSESSDELTNKLKSLQINHPDLLQYLLSATPEQLTALELLLCAKGHRS